MKKVFFFVFVFSSPRSEHHSSDYADDEDESDDEQEKASEGKEEKDKKERPRWTVVCSTEEEWRQLAESFKNSKNEDEKMLYESLSVDFLPEIGKMIVERQAGERKREEQERQQKKQLQAERRQEG